MTTRKKCVKNQKLYHTSNPFYRDLIANEGLTLQQRTWGFNGGSDYNKHLDKAIFCKKDEVYDSGYDDDVYEIDTENCPNEFFHDFGVDDGKCVYTLSNIDISYIKLIKFGKVVTK